MASRPRRTLKLAFPTNRSQQAEDARLMADVRLGKAKLQDLPPRLRADLRARLARKERRSLGMP